MRKTIFPIAVLLLLLSFTKVAPPPLLIYSEDFEGSVYLPEKGTAINLTESVETCDLPWTLATVTSPVFEGKKAVRIEIHKGQPLVGSKQRYRSEISVIKGDDDKRFKPDIWYSVAIFLPKDGSEPDNRRCAISQWFEDGSDETTLRTADGYAYLEVTPPLGSKPDSKSMKNYDLFSTAENTGENTDNFTKHPVDEWHEFVFHFIHSKGADGLIEVWRDGVKIHTIKGRNMHLMYPKWKVGLYESSLDKSNRDKKVIYLDKIKVQTTQPTPPNVPPTAEAGSDITITLPDNTVTLKGAANDPDGEVSTVWSNAGEYVGAALEQTVTGLTEGSYTYTLTVTDDDGAVAIDSVHVLVKKAINMLPVVNAGKDVTITRPLDSVTLYADADDADGKVVSTVWTEKDSIVGNSLRQNFYNLSVGTHIFNLYATDNLGGVSASSVKVTVLPEPSPIKGFTLINADKDKELMVLTDGAVFSLSSNTLSSLKERANLNIRADAEGVGSIVFDLTGPKNFKYIDSNAPYALAGNAGSNYYYVVLPVGNYTLTGTPWSGVKGTGKAGTAAVVRFTISQ